MSSLFSNGLISEKILETLQINVCNVMTSILYLQLKHCQKGKVWTQLTNLI